MNNYSYGSRSNSSGCFWFLVLLLIIGGPKLLGFLLVFVLMAVMLMVFAGIFFLKKFNLNEYLKQQSESHNQFGQYLIKFMIKVAGADGHIDENEVSLIYSFFQQHLNYNNTQMMWVETLVKEAIESDYTVEEICLDFKNIFGLSEQKILVQLLYQIALVDQYIHQDEQKLIDKIVRLLGFPENEHVFIKNMFQRQSQGEDPFVVLGISSSASKDEIKKRYRELSKENHPDKVDHLGDEFKKVAEEKMAKINDAYQKLKKTGKV